MKKPIVVVLAAGKSKRMRSDTSKVLHRLQSKTIIRFVYESLKKAGAGKVISVCSGDNREALIKEAILEGLSCEAVVQKQQKGTADAVRIALSAVRPSHSFVLVTSGDMPLIASSTYRKLIAEFFHTRAHCTLLTGLMPDADGYGRIIRKGAQIKAIREQKDLFPGEDALQEINAGIYMFRLASLRKYIARIRNTNRQKEFYLTDIISLFVENGLKVNSVTARSHEEIQGINTRQDLSRLMAVLWKAKNEELMTKGVTIEDPASTFIDRDVLVGRDTIIKPYSIIEGGTRIGKKCVIGPFAHIRNQANIMDTAEIGNFVEVKKSVVMPGAKAKHLTYLGDATVGKKANIGAGTITANFDGKNKFPTFIGDNCYIGSNTVLIAPLRLGKGVKTGSGAIVTRGQNIPAHSLLVGVPAKIIKKVSSKQ